MKRTPAPCLLPPLPPAVEARVLSMMSLTESALTLELDLEFSFANGFRLPRSAFSPKPPAHRCFF